MTGMVGLHPAGEWRGQDRWAQSSEWPSPVVPAHPTPTLVRVVLASAMLERLVWLWGDRSHMPPSSPGKPPLTPLSAPTHETHGHLDGALRLTIVH